MFELDKLDRKILFELDCDSRQSFSQLARKMKQARDTVEYRVQRLKKEGVIRRFTIIVNPMRMGLTVFNVYLRLAANHEERQQLLKFLARSKGVYWIAECAGQWDMIFAMAMKDNREFYKVHAQILSMFSKLVIDSAVHTLVDAWLCAKDYVLNEASGRHVHLGEIEETFEVDEKDQLLLKTLLENSRTPLTELAQALGISTEAVSHRIERLEKRKIMAGSRVDLELDYINKQHFKAQLFFTHFTNETEKTFRNFCLAHPNITYYLQEIGPCPVELEVEVKSYRRYHEIMDEMRAAAPGALRNIHSIVIRKAGQTGGVILSVSRYLPGETAESRYGKR